MILDQSIIALAHEKYIMAPSGGWQIGFKEDLLDSACMLPVWLAFNQMNLVLSELTARLGKPFRCCDIG